MNNFLGSGGNTYGGQGGQPGAGNYDSGRQDNGAGNGPSTNGGERVGGPTGNLTQRAGGQIDSSIAGSFDAMVAAAARDGVRLEIRSAFRSRREQERLYAAYRNGTGNLAARPGTSNHERGQAIDFKGNRGAWDWLARNAERFGFRNLPGEPWHYSPTGR